MSKSTAHTDTRLPAQEAARSWTQARCVNARGWVSLILMEPRTCLRERPLTISVCERCVPLITYAYRIAHIHVCVRIKNTWRGSCIGNKLLSGVIGQRMKERKEEENKRKGGVAGEAFIFHLLSTALTYFKGWGARKSQNSGGGGIPR